jgi:hypothetical protein
MHSCTNKSNGGLITFLLGALPPNVPHTAAAFAAVRHHLAVHCLLRAGLSAMQPAGPHMSCCQRTWQQRCAAHWSSRQQQSSRKQQRRPRQHHQQQLLLVHRLQQSLLLLLLLMVRQLLLTVLQLLLKQATLMLQQQQQVQGTQLKHSRQLVTLK